MENPYNKENIITYINSLKSYQGYVQFSDRPIEDIFEEFSDIHVEPKDGFVYEAHFYNNIQSIAIKQINNYWLVDETPCSHSELDSESKEINIYIGINKLKVNMAQIWEEKEDELCENMLVKKLKKVVFVGFKKGESK